MAFFGSIVSGAKLSDCLKYRYQLWRIWANKRPLLVWVMLNPSKANATEDDHTIRWCKRYASENGYGGILVVNLFAYRATMPADMKAANDPIGPENNRQIVSATKECVLSGGKVIVAWGVHGEFQDRDLAVLKLIRATYGQAPFCLGVTKGGFPMHPARLSPKLSLRPYEGRP